MDAQGGGCAARCGPLSNHGGPKGRLRGPDAAPFLCVVSWRVKPSCRRHFWAQVFPPPSSRVPSALLQWRRSTSRTTRSSHTSGSKNSVTMLHQTGPRLGESALRRALFIAKKRGGGRTRGEAELEPRMPTEAGLHAPRNDAKKGGRTGPRNRPFGPPRLLRGSHRAVQPPPWASTVAPLFL